MAKDKDPAFLFYSKDWLEGTGEMTPEEKGVYIDLLAHQHQKGSLPPETKRLAKLVGLSESDFNRIWVDLATKFIPNGSGRLVNRKLNGVVTERADKAWRNKIIGTLASVVRYSNVPREISEKAKKTFKVDDFLGCPEQNLTERITEWYQKRLKSIENVNVNEDANVNSRVGGMGEEKFLGPQMVEAFIKAFPEYPIDKNLDYSACLEIGYKIASAKGWDRRDVVNGKKTDIISEWMLMISFIRSDKWYSTRSISDLNKEFQRLMQSMKNGTVVRSSNATGIPKAEIVTERGTRNF